MHVRSNPTSNIKYLYLYFCKGEDRVVCSVQTDADNDPNLSTNECKQHLNGQWHSPESSVWKLLSLKMDKQSHHCFTLLLSYPGQEYVRFDQEADPEDIEANAETQANKNHTRAFFALNIFENGLRFCAKMDPWNRDPPSEAKSIGLDGKWHAEPPRMITVVSRGVRTTKAQTRLDYLGQNEQRQPYKHAKLLKYEEIPYYYTWQPKEAIFQRRSAPHFDEKMVTRIAVIRPSAGDIFYMRLRLLYDCCKGATSYDDLKMAFRNNNDPKQRKQCETFKAACILEGLVANDSEWREALQEGVELKCGKSLRSTFVEILMNCEPENPRNLWEEFKEELAADIAHDNGRGEAPSAVDCNEALRQIRDELQDFPTPKLLEDLGLPSVDESSQPPSSECAEIRAELMLSENRQAELLARYEAKLGNANEGQQIVWNKLKSDIDEVFEELQAGTRDARGNLDYRPTRERTHFIYARGGFGKTFLDEMMLDYVRGHDGIALAMASSGIAALLLEGARTVHSRCKVPLEISDENMRCGFRKQSTTARLIKRAVILLWDEVCAPSHEC